MFFKYLCFLSIKYNARFDIIYKYTFFISYSPAGESPCAALFLPHLKSSYSIEVSWGFPPPPPPPPPRRSVWCCRETPVSGAACTSGRHRELSALDLATTYTRGTKPPPRMGTADTLWYPFGSPLVLLWAAAAPNTTRLPTYAHEGVRDTGTKGVNKRLRQPVSRRNSTPWGPSR